MIGHCDSCGFDDVDVQEYGNVTPELLRRPRHCEVCASTFVPRAGEGESLRAMHLFRTLAVGFNLILREIRKLRDGR